MRLDSRYTGHWSSHFFPCHQAARATIPAQLDPGSLPNSHSDLCAARTAREPRLTVTQHRYTHHIATTEPTERHAIQLSSNTWVTDEPLAQHAHH